MALAQIYVLVGYVLTTAGFAWRYGAISLMVAGAIFGLFGLFAINVDRGDSK